MGLIKWSDDQIMSLALSKMASVFPIWSSVLKICKIILKTLSYKVYYVSLDVVPTLHPNY